MSQISRRPAQEDQLIGSTVTSETMDTFSQLSTADAGLIHSRWRISSEHLIEAAEALEERASWLRQLARRSQTIDSTHYGVQQHVPPPQQMVQPSNPNQLAFGARLTSVAEALQQSDATTIFHSDGTLRTGITPTGEYQTWDMDMQSPQSSGPHDLHFGQYDFAQLGCMERALHAQLLADQEATASAARSGQGRETDTYHLRQQSCALSLPAIRYLL
ncbi:hypothetical protein LTR56_025886 [Elasticomyces elasticus]|nr:hypothetical protein LTR56_025886 [Elasticomyces elasticus]KAK5738855.1 hypothetical protein LTS12_025477 [Elasticomyces elasticus]